VRKHTCVLMAAGAIALVAVGLVAAEHQAYRWAVEADARARGFGRRPIRFVGHWPLGAFDSVLGAANDPYLTERLLRGADTIVYYLVPVSGTPDTALVQEARFAFAMRENSVVIDFRVGQRVFVDGSDAVPSPAYQVPRDTALRWFTSAANHPSMERRPHR